MIDFYLPPAPTFLHRALKTSLLLVFSYIPINFEMSEDKIVTEKFSDEDFKDALQDFINDLREGKYGLKPLLRADASRIRKSLLGKWGLEFERVNVLTISTGYMKYVEELAKEGKLVEELRRAFSSISDEGYVEDSKIISVPMLNKLAPEFMEGVRVFGGIYMGGSVPSRMRFSRMKLGVHTACLGILGLWSTLFYADEKTEHYLFPNPKTLRGLIILDHIKGNLKRVIGALRGRPFMGYWTALLLTSLLTAETPAISRIIEIASLSKGEKRDDIIRQSLILFNESLALFADRLEENTRLKLITLCKRILDPDLKDIVIKISKSIILSAEGVIDPVRTAYNIARYTYLQSNINLEKTIGLTSRDVNRIVEALRYAWGKIKAGG